MNLPKSGCACIKKFCCGLGGGLSRTKNRSGTRCAHQFWPQSARSAASARGRPAAWPAAGQAARARARIQPKSPRASRQISEFRSCMHSVSWIHARAGGWEAAHAIIALRNFLRANPSQPPIADLLNFDRFAKLFLNLSKYKIFHDFMHMRAKTICEFTAERSTA